MMTAIALDDEPPALKVIEKFCEKTDFVSLLSTFTKPSDTQQFINNNPVDLLFLDINMPAITGIDFYKDQHRQMMVIFTTAYSEYAVEGFNLNAIDYLLKPYTFDRFLQAARKAEEYYKNILQKEEPQNLFFVIRADYASVKIAFSDIVLIEGLDDYLKIYLENAKPLVARMTMKSILQKLPEKDFLRVHRSFIVPFNKIKTVRNKIIYLGGIEIPIGSTYEETVFSRISG